ncbi:hypothetical protein BC829DRAFT_379615 [Chytridium lagenaria]|nr:hypothetical protein BC829DRAFT_379615 [Chytridium lagenaria]
MPNSSLTLQQYQLGECLGKGAFGSVYRAFDLETGKVMAIKQIKISNMPKSEIKSIMAEIDLLKRLNHENIVAYSGFVKTNDTLNIVLEAKGLRFCENGSLLTIMKKFGKFTEHLVALYIGQVLDGLSFLHDQGVIHRDIKAANILSTKHGVVKLADFGVAAKISEAANPNVVGSPYWMAPEVIELYGSNVTSDIWSVGCTIIELLQGSPPYSNLNALTALFHIVQDDHPPFPDGISIGLRDFLLRCLHKDFNLRPSAAILLRHNWLAKAKQKIAMDAKPDKDSDKLKLELDREKKISSFSQKDTPMSPRKPKVSKNTWMSENDEEDWENDFDLHRSNSLFQSKAMTHNLLVLKKLPLQEPTRKSSLSKQFLEDIPEHISSKALTVSTPEEVSFDLSEDPFSILLDDGDGEMTDTVREFPDFRRVLKTHHYLISILDLFEERPLNGKAQAHILRFLNQALKDNVEMQEFFCLVGGLPILFQRAIASFDAEGIHETVMLITELTAKGNLSLQSLLACRGLHVLNSFLDARNKVVQKGTTFAVIQAVSSILSSQGKGAKSDYCRILARLGFIKRLTYHLAEIWKDRSTQTSEIISCIIGILLEFSQGEAIVKESLLESETLRILVHSLPYLRLADLVLMLKCIKNVVVSSTAIELLSNFGLVETILRLEELTPVKEIQNQVVQILFHLTRLNPARQERAVVCGAVPFLQYFIKQKNPLKSFAIPIFCEISHSTQVCLRVLRQYFGLDTYLFLLTDHHWRVNALESILSWLGRDKEYVEDELDKKAADVVSIFEAAQGTELDAFLTTFRKLVELSSRLSRTFANTAIPKRLITRLDSAKAQVRLDVLRIFHCFGPYYEVSTVDALELPFKMRAMASNDAAVLVRELASSVCARIKFDYQ